MPSSPYTNLQYIKYQVLPDATFSATNAIYAIRDIIARNLKLVALRVEDLPVSLAVESPTIDDIVFVDYLGNSNFSFSSNNLYMEDNVSDETAEQVIEDLEGLYVNGEVLTVFSGEGYAEPLTVTATIRKR